MGGTVALAAVAVAALALALDSPEPAGLGDQASGAAGAGCPAKVRAPGPPTARQLTPLWSGDAEEGTLADWRRPEQAPGGGEFNSGSGRAAATRAAARTGAWGARLTLGDGDGGARLFRWQELRAHRDVVVSVWLKLPRRYRLTADPRTGRFWNVFQFKSRAVSGGSEPLWYLNLAHRPGQRSRIELLWGHGRPEGPRAGQSGFRRFRQRVAHVPIGRWFRITAELRQSSAFDGAVCVWQGRRRLFALSGVRTSFANCKYNAWCAANEWSVNNYSDGLAPSPAVLYVDDARIAAVGG